MNKLYHSLFVLAAIALFSNACSSWEIRSHNISQPASTRVTYEVLLGKFLNDKTVNDFLAMHHCSSADRFRLCQNTGVALWINSNQIVEIIYLYLNNTNGFEPYQGPLPFGLKFYDTLGAVEYKLKRHGIGYDGFLPTTATPDHRHYHATYQEAGMTILYNSPFPDEDATIYSILIYQSNQLGSMGQNSQ